MIYARNIKWETDGESVNLPREVELPEIGIVDQKCCEDWRNCENNSESVNNYLSDRFGWLVESYEITDEQAIGECEDCGELYGNEIHECPFILCIYCGKHKEFETDLQLCEDCMGKYDTDRLWKDHDENKVDALDFNESNTFRNKYLIK